MFGSNSQAPEDDVSRTISVRAAWTWSRRFQYNSAPNPRACLVVFKISKLYKNSPSHQIFQRMHEVLNVGKQNN